MNATTALPGSIEDSARLRAFASWSLALAAPAVAAPIWSLLASLVPGAGDVANLSSLVLIGAVGVSAATDAARGKIYNKVTYVAAFWALVLALFWGPDARILGLPTGAIGAGDALFGGLICFGAMFVSLMTAGGGGGDLKLATAIGLLLGAERGFMALVYTYALAGVFSLAYMAVLGGIGSAASVVAGRFGLGLLTARWGASAERRRELLKLKIRMGPFFAGGVAVVLLERIYG